MKIGFKCPSCLRKTLRVEASNVAITIHNLTCPKCGSKWRYRVKLISQNEEATIHIVENTAKLP